MSEWQSVQLGDLTTLHYGKALKAENRFKGSVPVFSSAGLTGYHNAALVNSQGLIIGRKGTVGKTYYSAKPFWCIDTAYYVLPDDNKYDLQFLYHLLKTLGLEELNEDSAVPGLNRDTAYKQQFSLPPLPEQKAIAAVLSSLDETSICCTARAKPSKPWLKHCSASGLWRRRRRIGKKNAR